MNRFRYVAAVLTSLLAFIVLAAVPLRGDEPAEPRREVRQLDTKQHARDLAVRFMETIARGQIDDAFDLVTPYYPFEPAEIDQKIRKPFLDSQAFIRERFGAPVGQEFVAERGARDFLFSVEHAMKYERHAMHWTFIFYKPRDRWILTTLRYSDRIENFLN